MHGARARPAAGPAGGLCVRRDSRPVAHNSQACELACRGVPCSAPFCHLLAQVVVGEQKAETENVFVGGRNRCVGSWSVCDGARLPVLGCEAGGGALARCFQLAPGRPSLSSTGRRVRLPGLAPSACGLILVAFCPSPCLQVVLRQLCQLGVLVAWLPCAGLLQGAPRPPAPLPHAFNTRAVAGSSLKHMRAPALTGEGVHDRPWARVQGLWSMIFE